MQETRVRSLGREDPLENEMATHSSILAWRISLREEPGRLQSVGLQRITHYWMTNTQKHFKITRYQGWQEIQSQLLGLSLPGISKSLKYRKWSLLVWVAQVTFAMPCKKPASVEWWATHMCWVLASPGPVRALLTLWAVTPQALWKWNSSISLILFHHWEKSPTSVPLSFGKTKTQKKSCMWDISFPFWPFLKAKKHRTWCVWQDWG